MLSPGERPSLVSVPALLAQRFQPEFPIWFFVSDQHTSKRLRLCQFLEFSIPERLRTNGSDGACSRYEKDRKYLSAFDFSDTSPSQPLSVSMFVCLPPFLSSRQGHRRDPPRNRPEDPPRQMTFGQQEPVVASVLHQPPTRLHQPLLQAG
jgi:hypothetical protein